VQGVGFRVSAEEEAMVLGLAGWVRNLADGRVEIVAEGYRDAVEELAEWCRHGPPFSKVAGVEVSWEEPCGDLHDFRIRRG
jgi:acylphosphatase